MTKRNIRLSAIAPGLALALGALAAVPAHSALPSGYTQHEFIQGNATGSSDNANAGYIITDIVPNPKTDTINAEFEMVGTHQQGIWCARGSSYTVKTWTLLYTSAQKFRFDYYSTASKTSAATYSNVKINADVANNICTLTKEGGTGDTISNTANSSFTETGGPIMFFTIGNYNGSAYSGFSNYSNSKLYSFTITRGGVVIHNLVPAVRDSDSQPGLYDKTTDTFYPGTGSFTMGGIVLSTDTILEVSASPDGIGSPSPAYGITNGLAAGASFTVSCGATPVTDADGTTQYSCTGWKLYDGTNAVVSTGAGTSFTYVHPTPAAKRRLEWQWDVSAYRGTIASGHGGTVSQSGGAWYPAATPVTITATPNAGSGFVRWTGTLPDGVSTTSASATFTPTAPFSMTAVFETVGSSDLVFLNERTSSYWHTATNRVLALPIEFPEGASSATLSVTGPDYSTQYSIPAGTAQYTLSLPAATSPTTENVYDLALAFNDSDSTVRTAKLGLIEGHDATTTGWTRCLAPMTQRKWGWVRGRVVIPVPYGSEPLAVGGVTVDTGLDGAQGWYPLTLRGGQSAVLTLDNGASATLFRPPESTTFIMQ